MIRILLFLCFIPIEFATAVASEITPFKYADTPAPYDIPAASRLTATRATNAPEIVCYLSKPEIITKFFEWLKSKLFNSQQTEEVSL